MDLIAKDITVAFGKAQIVRGIDFAASAGQVAVIVGPNGSGKTTLLKAMTNELPYRGQVHLNGSDIRTLTSADLASMRAVLPQSGAISFPFTVLEIVRLGLTAGVPGPLSDRIDMLPVRALARVGLAGYEGRFFQDLSGGEKQRVQLARVLVQVWEPVLDGRPRWVFLDEPISALDIGHQLIVMDIARDFARAGGGVVAVLHDLNLTAMYADRVTLLHRGRVLAAGDPGEVLTDDHLSLAYDCAVRTKQTPPIGTTWLLPQMAQAHVHNEREVFF